MRKYFFLLIVSLLLISCDTFRSKHQAGTAVEVGNECLLLSDLEPLTRGLTGEDSARVADQYIQQWTSELLLYNEAKGAASEHLEKLVEDYRRSLYVHEYTQALATRKMSKIIPDSIIEQYYAEHLNQFILQENILKGLLLVLPNGTPKMDKLRKWLMTMDESSIELIEKYAYQYATGYELFTDRWRTGSQILLILPVQKDILQQKLKNSSIIEVQDSTSTYLLRVTDKYLIGDHMPLDYATPEIRTILLSQRQVGWLESYKKELFNEAVRFKKVKIYEN